MPVPTRRFVIVVLVTALALLVSPFGTWFAFWVVDLLLLLLLVADWAAAVRPSRITVVRELPGALAMNGTGTVGWTVGNPTTRPVVVGVSLVILLFALGWFIERVAGLAFMPI